MFTKNEIISLARDYVLLRQKPNSWVLWDMNQVWKKTSIL